MIHELSLFTGAGGGLYASLLLGWRTACAVEADPYRRDVLRARQRDGIFGPFPIFDDVRTFDGAAWRGRVDVVSGGFPCQPHSVAGKRLGGADARNLWPDMARIIRDVRPRFVFAENVPGLLTSGYFGQVLGDLAALGFDAEWGVLGAHDVGAPHRRERLWIVAYAQQDGRDGSTLSGSACSSEIEGRMLKPERRSADLPDSDSPELRAEQGRRESRRPRAAEPRNDGADGDVADARQERRTTRRIGSGETTAGEVFDDRVASSGSTRWWSRDPADEAPGSESFLGRVAHGVAHRRDRLAALGDGQVPLVAATAWHLLAARLGV